MRVRIGPYLGVRSKKKKRNIKIEIENFDVWSLDHTLSLIIYPALIKLKKTAHGAPCVKDEDVPEELSSKNAIPKNPKDDEYTDSNWFKRWDWVLDEMIWAFKEISTDFKNEPEWDPKTASRKMGYEDYYKRISNGTRLFGVYYLGLWD